MAPETRQAGCDQIAPVSHENSIGASPTAQDQENPEFTMEQDEGAEDTAEPLGQIAQGAAPQTYAEGQPLSRTSST
jgi:hypothetical protein